MLRLGGRRVRSDGIPKDVCQPLCMRCGDVGVEYRQVTANSRLAQERDEREVASLAEDPRIVMLRYPGGNRTFKSRTRDMNSGRPESTYTEIALPGALLRMPRPNISRGVKPWFANDAPCNVTDPVLLVIPAASATGPATEIQSGT